MSPSRAVVIQAVRWWKMRRPVGWTLEQHMTNPAVNTASEADKALAIAVGAMVAERGLPTEARSPMDDGVPSDLGKAKRQGGPPRPA